MFVELEEHQFTTALDAVQERIDMGEDPEKARDEVVDYVANTLHAMLTEELDLEE